MLFGLVFASNVGAGIMVLPPNSTSTVYAQNTTSVTSTISQMSSLLILIICIIVILIVIVIGLLQFSGAVHMTPQPVVKQAHQIFGFLEVLLGIVVLAAPIDWEANAVAFVWLVAAAIYMLYVASRLRK